MMTPPIVGGPAFDLWLSGPSARISSPNFSLRSQLMTNCPKMSTSASEVSAAYAERNEM